MPSCTVDQVHKCNQVVHGFGLVVGAGCSSTVCVPDQLTIVVMSSSSVSGPYLASAVPIANAEAITARAMRSTVDSHTLGRIDSYSGRRLQAGTSVLVKERCRDSVQCLRGVSRLIVFLAITEASIEHHLHNENENTSDIIEHQGYYLGTYSSNS